MIQVICLQSLKGMSLKVWMPECGIWRHLRDNIPMISDGLFLTKEEVPESKEMKGQSGPIRFKTHAISADKCLFFLNDTAIEIVESQQITS